MSGVASQRWQARRQDSRAGTPNPAASLQALISRPAAQAHAVASPTCTPRSAMVRQASASASVPISSTITISGICGKNDAGSWHMPFAMPWQAQQQQGQQALYYCLETNSPCPQRRDKNTLLDDSHGSQQPQSAELGQGAKKESRCWSPLVEQGGGVYRPCMGEPHTCGDSAAPSKPQAPHPQLHPHHYPR